jgi:hypothetical protein
LARRRFTNTISDFERDFLASSSSIAGGGLALGGASRIRDEEFEEPISYPLSPPIDSRLNHQQDDEDDDDALDYSRHQHEVLSEHERHMRHF